MLFDWAGDVYPGTFNNWDLVRWQADLLWIFLVFVFPSKFFCAELFDFFKKKRLCSQFLLRKVVQICRNHRKNSGTRGTESFKLCENDFISF